MKKFITLVFMSTFGIANTSAAQPSVPQGSTLIILASHPRIQNRPQIQQHRPQVQQHIQNRQQAHPQQRARLLLINIILFPIILAT